MNSTRFKAGPAAAVLALVFFLNPGATTAGHGGIAVYFPGEYRSIDGTGNNLADPARGSADTEFLRLTAIDYGDGAGTPSGAGRASARAISNACVSQDTSKPNHKRASDFVWQWGQFLDHDIDLTAVVDPAEPFDIPVPAGDPDFDPFNTGTVVIPLERSFYRIVDGVREQVNEITSYIDASNVYGSDATRAAELRTMDGTGRLRTSAGNLLPFNENHLPNAPTAHDASFFIAGDFRANEQVGLAAMHTLFVREHNFWARIFRKADSSLAGDEIYELARIMVAAEMQAITYNEFLPKLLGRNALAPYAGYQPDVDASISNVFATAAYRFGHSMLSPTLRRIDRHGRTIARGDLELADAFFRPGEIINGGGIDPILRGLASQTCQDVDLSLIDAVRNFLFGPPGSGGFDLGSLNIQRGRDHGLPSFNQVRVDFGLALAAGFADINPDPAIQAKLASVYATVDDVDAWVGGLAEPHVPGAMVGETCLVILKDQFERLRDGDRFWYRNYLSPHLARVVEAQKLSTIIRRNTGIRSEIPNDVFTVRAPRGGELKKPEKKKEPKESKGPKKGRKSKKGKKSK